MIVALVLHISNDTLDVSYFSRYASRPHNAGNGRVHTATLPRDVDPDEWVARQIKSYYKDKPELSMVIIHVDSRDEHSYLSLVDDKLKRALDIRTVTEWDLVGA